MVCILQCCDNVGFADRRDIWPACSFRDICSANIALNNSFRKVFNFFGDSKAVTDVLLVLTSLCFNTPTSFVVLEKMHIFR